MSKVHVSEKMSDLAVYLISALIVTLFLFFIDEGYYSFQWMTSVGSWIVFVVYAGGLLLSQILISSLIAKRLVGNTKRVLSLVVGIPVGFLILLFLFSGSI